MIETPRDSGRLPEGEDAERSGAAECGASQSGGAEGAASPSPSRSAATNVSDPRTGRPLGDHGTANDAVEFILNSPQIMAPDEGTEFLRAWREGDLDEWPEFYEWLAEREATLSPPLPSPDVERLPTEAMVDAGAQALAIWIITQLHTAFPEETYRDLARMCLRAALSTSLPSRHD